MSRCLRILGVLALGAALGCGEDKDPLATSASGVATGGPASAGSDSMGATTGGATTGGATTGDDPTGGSVDPYEVCQDYINCIAVTTPNGLPDAQAGFGEGSTCWGGTPADAELCGKACATGLEQYHDMFPAEAACDPCALGYACTTTEGTFLLAIQTPIGLVPFQFIVDGSLPLGPDGTLELTARPLSLDEGRIIVPRQPVGDTYEWSNVSVAGGSFQIDAGTITIPAEANPLFGVTVQVAAVLSGTVMGPDLFCGTVSGEVVDPVVQSLAGSTFAAVRVASANQLPLEVRIDCKGTLVSEP